MTASSVCKATVSFQVQKGQPKFSADRRRVHGAHGGHAGRKRAAVRVRKRVQLPRMAQRARGVPRVLARKHLVPRAPGLSHLSVWDDRRMRLGTGPQRRTSHDQVRKPVGAGAARDAVRPLRHARSRRMRTVAVAASAAAACAATSEPGCVALTTKAGRRMPLAAMSSGRPQ